MLAHAAGGDIEDFQGQGLLRHLDGRPGAGEPQLECTALLDHVVLQRGGEEFAQFAFGEQAGPASDPNRVRPGPAVRGQVRPGGLEGGHNLVASDEGRAPESGRRHEAHRNLKRGGIHAGRGGDLMEKNPAAVDLYHGQQGEVVRFALGRAGGLGERPDDECQGEDEKAEGAV